MQNFNQTWHRASQKILGPTEIHKRRATNYVIGRNSGSNLRIDAKALVTHDFQKSTGQSIDDWDGGWCGAVEVVAEARLGG